MQEAQPGMGHDRRLVGLDGQLVFALGFVHKGQGALRIRDVWVQLNRRLSSRFGLFKALSVGESFSQVGMGFGQVGIDAQRLLTHPLRSTYQLACHLFPAIDPVFVLHLLLIQDIQCDVHRQELLIVKHSVPIQRHPQHG